MEIELSDQPTPGELAAATLVLNEYGITDTREIMLLACLGTDENPRDMMHAAGVIVTGMTCYYCKKNRLDPSDKDALGVELCPTCYEAGGLANEHEDYAHDEPVSGCPSCPT